MQSKILHTISLQTISSIFLAPDAYIRYQTMMEYDVAADLLNKFSQLTPWVQVALGLEATALALGALYFVKETIAVAAGMIK